MCVCVCVCVCVCLRARVCVFDRHNIPAAPVNIRACFLSITLQRKKQETKKKNTEVSPSSVIVHEIFLLQICTL